MTSSRFQYRGFTLIELLVVIAIIGILSTVILAALALAKFKAADADVKANLHNVVVEMENYYDDHGRSYGTPLGCQLSPSGTILSGANGFFNDSNVTNAMIAAINAGGFGYWSIGKGGQTYAIAIPLKADSSNFWCIDNTSQKAHVTAATNFPGSCASSMQGGASNNSVCPP